jgi:N-acetylglucosamine-6-phosphate deacetylase
MANGDHIQTWINGKRICDLKDDMTASGFIALQVHGIGKRDEKWQVKWRNIVVKELP